MRPIENNKGPRYMIPSSQTATERNQKKPAEDELTIPLADRTGTKQEPEPNQLANQSRDQHSLTKEGRLLPTFTTITSSFFSSFFGSHE